MGKNIPSAPVTPAGDQANAVLTGTIAAVGPTLPLPVYGSFNVTLWGSVATTLTTSAGAATGTVASGTGIAVGQSIVCASLPPGTTVGDISSTTVTFAFPPDYTSDDVLAGTTVAAVFNSVAVSATVRLERSFDGGYTWIVASTDATGTAASWANPSAVSVIGVEPERGDAWRLNCTVYSSGTLNYRVSQTGPMATSNSVVVA